MSDDLVLLAAGGTGGHLFPAQALAEELGRRGVTVELVTDERGDRYGMSFPARQVHQIPSATLAGRSPVAVARTLTRLGRGVASAYGLLGRIRPKVVVGFGGYPTFPPLTAARFRGIRSAIHEQNAVMGRANRMLAKHVTAIACSWDGTRNLPESAAGKVRVTGNPVRQAVIEASRRPYDPPGAGAPLRLLVFGGSQGARYFSETVPPALEALPAELRGRLQVVQQCREEDLEAVRTRYQRAGIAAELGAFFRDLPERIAASQLVIARSGASSVAELAVLGRPAILVPLPHALDNDQLHNARRLEQAGGAWCLEQRNLTPARLGTEIGALLASGDRLAAAAAAVGALGKPEAVARLADLVQELARGATPRPA